jgi:hypothetical protein
MMSKEALQLYGHVIGMPRVAPYNADLFYARVRFYETLFGPLINDHSGNPYYISWNDCRIHRFDLPSFKYEAGSEFAARMYKRFRNQCTKECTNGKT